MVVAVITPFVIVAVAVAVDPIPELYYFHLEGNWLGIQQKKV